MSEDNNLVISIHQPNYLPWAGYFYKIARSDFFVFLDDVQYSKNSYINRVQILGNKNPRWLTIPVSVKFGESINRVRSSKVSWMNSHLDTLTTFYSKAPAFNEIMNWLEKLYLSLDDVDIAEINQFIIENIAVKMGLSCQFKKSSDLKIDNAKGDDRLIKITSSISPNGVYLSGKGGSNYQNSEKFINAGLTLKYTDFIHPSYNQGNEEFISGLSIIDALFHMGWSETGKLFINDI